MKELHIDNLKPYIYEWDKWEDIEGDFLKIKSDHEQYTNKIQELLTYVSYQTQKIVYGGVGSITSSVSTGGWAAAVSAVSSTASSATSTVSSAVSKVVPKVVSTGRDVASATVSAVGDILNGSKKPIPINTLLRYKIVNVIDKLFDTVYKNPIIYKDDMLSTRELKEFAKKGIYYFYDSNRWRHHFKRTFREIGSVDAKVYYIPRRNYNTTSYKWSKMMTRYPNLGNKINIRDVEWIVEKIRSENTDPKTASTIFISRNLKSPSEDKFYINIYNYQEMGILKHTDIIKKYYQINNVYSRNNKLLLPVFKDELHEVYTYTREDKDFDPFTKEKCKLDIH